MRVESMRDFISELRGFISSLEDKKMTDIPVPTPLTPVELAEKVSKEYINTKIDEVIEAIDSVVSVLSGESPFVHTTEPRKKTRNEMYIDFDELVDIITMYGDNYKTTAKQSYTSDIVENSKFINFAFTEIPALDVSVYNTSDTSFWSGIDPVTEKLIVDRLFVRIETEITTFNNLLTSNSRNIDIINAENRGYIARLKKFLALDKTAKYLTNVDPIGQALYDSRDVTNRAKIDEILSNQAIMSDEVMAAYMAAERESLKIERV